MYHCHVRFYLIGSQSNLWDIIKAMPPLEHFSHEFQVSSKPDSDLAAKADVILADLQGTDAKETVNMLCNCKKIN